MSLNNVFYNNCLKEGKKTPVPILSFPSCKMLGVSVKELVMSSDLMAEGLKKIAEKFKMGAAVSFMDLSVEAECFGADITFSDDEVPTVTGSIVSTMEEARALKVPALSAGRAGLYIDAVKKAKAGIKDRPVLAGCIGPFSLAGRLMNVTEIMIYCYEDEEMVHTVLKKCTEFLKTYIKAYKDAGADGILMAEPLAGLLSPSLAADFSSVYVKEIADELQDDSFVIAYHNCGGNTVLQIDSILETGCKVLHFGDAIDMAEMMPHIPADVVAMGNVSPSGCFKNGTKEELREATLDVLGKCSKYNNFIISSGCDIPPNSPMENIEEFFCTVRDYYSE